MRSSTAGLLLAIVVTRAASPAGATPPGPTDWPTYGHDLHRTFHGVTTLTPASVQALAPAWFFPTGDAVTANPIVVNGAVYVGSWDGFFYALDAQTGRERWHYKVKPQPGVHPATSDTPGQSGRLAQYLKDLTVANDPAKLADDLQKDVTSDGGVITASAFFHPGNALSNGRDLVIFASGYTLYALHADDGTEFFPPHDYPGTGCATTGVNGVCLPAGDPAKDPARIFSSPAVVGNRILFAVDADGSVGYRGYLVSANLTTGRPQWILELDGTDSSGQFLNDGCGNVWASPTVIDIRKQPDKPNSAKMTVQIVSTSDCDFDNPGYHEKTLAVDVKTGSIHWVFDPGRLDDHCDWDFGATANYGTDPSGDAFLGVAGKDGTYYRIDPDRGTLVWRKNVVFGGLAGGFIGSTAFDGTRAYGATALGDFGRFEGAGALGCKPGESNSDGNVDLLVQEPSVHAFDAETGSVPWQGVLSQSFGPTTTAGGMVFVGTGLTRLIEIRDAATGTLLKIILLPAATDSGVIPSGDSIYFGLGSSELGFPAGVAAFRPPAGLLGPLNQLPPLPLPSLPLPIRP